MTTTAAAKVDERLTPVVSTDTLIRLWADHTPAFEPAPSACEGCGHHYSQGAPLCPTAALVRPLLWRRRHEYGIGRVIAALTLNQWSDLASPIHRISTATGGGWR